MRSWLRNNEKIKLHNKGKNLNKEITKNLNSCQEQKNNWLWFK